MTVSDLRNDLTPLETEVNHDDDSRTWTHTLAFTNPPQNGGKLSSKWI
jgi:hypothetical protein